MASFDRGARPEASARDLTSQAPAATLELLPRLMVKQNSILRHRLIREQGPLLALILVMFLAFALQVVLGREGYYPFMTVPVEVTQSWRNLLQGDVSGPTLLSFGTLLTSAFLHGGIEHLLFNMLFLWIFAALVVELLGQRWMILIFLLSAISGSVFHVAVNAQEQIPMLGASGVVMGFMGAYLGLTLRWRLPDPHVWPISRPIPPGNLALLAIIGIAFDVFGIVGGERTGIAYGAHIGGFLAGLFVTSFLVRSLKTTTT